MALHVLNHLLPFQVLLSPYFNYPSFIITRAAPASSSAGELTARLTTGQAACGIYILILLRQWASERLIAQEKLLEDIPTPSQRVHCPAFHRLNCV